MARTQRNKATERHFGVLKAKLAKLRRELITPKGGSSGPGEGFDVAKTGDARIGFVGEITRQLYYHHPFQKERKRGHHYCFLVYSHTCVHVYTHPSPLPPCFYLFLRIPLSRQVHSPDQLGRSLLRSSIL